MLCSRDAADRSSVVGLPHATMEFCASPAYARDRSVETAQLVPTISLSAGFVLVSGCRVLQTALVSSVVVVPCAMGKNHAHVLKLGETKNAIITIKYYDYY